MSNVINKLLYCLAVTGAVLSFSGDVDAMNTNYTGNNRRELAQEVQLIKNPEVARAIEDAKAESKGTFLISKHCCGEGSFTIYAKNGELVGVTRRDENGSKVRTFRNGMGTHVEHRDDGDVTVVNCPVCTIL